MVKVWRNGYKRPNPERDKEVRRIRDRKMRQENKRLFKQLKKNLACIRCSENHPATLDFHHRDSSTKILEVSVMIMNRTWSQILTEIEKCDVLCSNCHRKEHWKES